MNINDYYYHSVSKDSSYLEDKYKTLEDILKSKAILSRNYSGVKSDEITLNGDNYVSIASYVKPMNYKVPILEETDFNDSNMSKLYNSYQDYLSDIEKDNFISTPLSQEEFFKNNKTNEKRQYFRYLDSLSRKFPIDLDFLFKDELDNDDILKYIYDKCQTMNNISYYFANEIAFKKYIVDSSSITFVISKDINTERTILIPNLEEKFFPKEMELDIANSVDKRYTNLIGEIQVKDKIDMKYIKGIIIDDNIDIKRVKKILNIYKLDIPLLKLDLDKELLEII